MRTTLLVILAAALALGACGRKGAPVRPQAAAQAETPAEAPPATAAEPDAEE